MPPLIFYSDKAQMEPLEIDIDILREQVAQLRSMKAEMETALLAAARWCYLKKSGFCYVNCKIMPYCDCFSLHLLKYQELPEWCINAES